MLNLDGHHVALCRKLVDCGLVGEWRDDVFVGNAGSRAVRGGIHNDDPHSERPGSYSEHAPELPASEYSDAHGIHRGGGRKD